MLTSSPRRLRQRFLAVTGSVAVLLILIPLPRVASADPTAGPSPTPLPVGTPSVVPTPSATGAPTAGSAPSPTGTPTADPKPLSTGTPVASAEAADEPVRPLALTSISGVLRNAETGGPIRSSCVARRSADGFATNVTNVQDDGTWSIEVDTEAGPSRLAFYVVDDYNCSGPVQSDDYLPAWYENQTFTGTDPFTAVPPSGATLVDPGTTGIVACLARDALATACATPTTALSGTVVGIGPRPVEQACVVVINPNGAVGEPGITDANGRWRVDGLANDTPLVVAAIPTLSTTGRPCEFGEGPPPSPGPGELQPEFYRNLWADFDQSPENPLFADPYEWATERGATTVTNSTSGITICLTTDPGTVVPRPSCDPSTPTPTPSAGVGPEATSTSIPAPASATGPGLADTGGPPAWWVPVAFVLMAAGTVLTRRRPISSVRGRPGR